MAPKRKLPWTDYFRSRPPPTGKPSHSTPSDSLAVDDPTPTGITAVKPTTTASVALTPRVVSAQQVIQAEQSPAIGSLKAALEALRSELSALPPLQLAVGELLECIVGSQVEERSRQIFDDLAPDLAELTIRLQEHVVESKPRNVPHSISNFAQAISEQVKTIKGCQDRSISRLDSESEGEDIVLKCYRRIEGLFRQLQEDISLSDWDTKKEKQTNSRLRDLSPAHEARYNAALPTTVTKRVGCTKGTRVKLLDDAKNWVCDPNGAKIHWLNGMAGTGKTTIAYTLCKMLYEGWQLGASFFCSRNSPDCRDVNRIVPTIAYQLGRYSNPYRQTLSRVLEADPDIAKHDISTQFAQLISKPLAEMGKAMPTDVVVVIDALDECTDVGGTKDILNLLLRHAGKLPIKFFISSRPEPALSNRMTAPGGAMRSILWLHDIEQPLVQADIRAYLAEALETMEATSDEIDQLAARAGSLFIFAATAVRYILPDMDSVDHSQRLQTVLKIKSNKMSKAYQDIDELYAAILANALDEKRLEQHELGGRRQALHTVVCAREPLTISALAEILDLTNDREVHLAIQPLQSVLHVSESTNIVSTLHASFPEFLFDKERAGRFHCDEALQSAVLAECCFRAMERSLRFNICGLKSSYLFDREVPDFKNRVDEAISTGLFYSCIYWGYHLTQGSVSDPLLSSLNIFIQHRLLFWLEVLSLKGRLGYGGVVLGQTLSWLPMEECVAELRSSIHDARSFVVTLASSPVSLSTPHIYISALPFTPRQSHVWATYRPKTRGLMSVNGADIETKRNPMLATWRTQGGVHSISQSSSGKFVASGSAGLGRGSFGDDQYGEIRIWDISSGTCILGPLNAYETGMIVKSVAFSPDDTRLASGSSDGTICVWDASKGGLIAGPLRSHASSVNSVAFSPDGDRLASGSDDQTIRLWDAYTGTSLNEPFHGHQGAVQSVGFSPDGKHLASGSSDSTIRVWDSWTGTISQGPIEGHTDAVYSVAYCRGGLQLVSGSRDCTVRVWDMSNGSLLAGPFEGHTDTVTSVSFSPDRTRIVSGSDDSTIRVWETVSGRLLAGPLKGYGSRVNSVLFSVDGTRVLSGSSDGTICVWDPHHETASVTVSEGHTSSVNSIALSRNGARIASGWHDGTIHVWDAHNGTLVAGPFTGHTDSITSVALSLDEARVVSGSRDNTLRVWDASNGALLVGPIEGHTGPVRSVAFSPGGSLIASGSDDGTIRLWGSCTGESVAAPFQGRAGPVVSVTFSPDGSRICSGFDLFFPPSLRTVHLGGYTVQMWEVNDGTTLWRYNAHARGARCVAFSPDGTRVMSGSDDHAILVLDASDGTVLHGPFSAHKAWFMSVAFSSDGTRVVSGSRDGNVRIRDVTNGTIVAGPVKGHQDGVRSVVFSPNGARLISGSTDGTIRIWDVGAIARASATSSDSWTIDRDGWLTSSKSQRLLWVPPDFRERFGFLTPSNPIVINANYTTRIDDATLLGDRWQECYVGYAAAVSS